MGCIYRRNDSPYLWISYSKDGRSFRESSKSAKKEDAKKLLRLREGEIAQGKQPSFIFDRIGFEELLEDLIADYKVNERKNLRSMNSIVAVLKKELGG